jgi:hypothetical protein
MSLEVLRGSEDVHGGLLQPWRYRQDVSPERWYPFTSSHGVTTQKTTTDTQK